MTLQETKDLLEVAKCISDRIAMERKHYDELFEDFNGCNMGLCNALDGIIDTLDKHLGNNGWISWYVFECDFGQSPMKAGVGDDMNLVDSVDKLYALAIEEMSE